MKIQKIIFNLKSKSKSEITGVIATVAIVAGELLALALDFLGFFELSTGTMLQIVIFDMSVLISLHVIERYGVLDDIVQQNDPRNSKRATYVTTREKYETEANDDVRRSWDRATEIDICAIANTSFLRGNGVLSIRKLAQKGVKIHFISLNPKSTLMQEYIKSKILNEQSMPPEDNIKTYLRECRRNDKFKKNVKLQLCDTILPYSLIIVKRKDQVQYIKVDSYALNAELKDRRCFIIPSTDDENISFYLNQWEYIWNHSESVSANESEYAT